MYYGPYLEDVRQRAALLPTFVRELLAGGMAGTIGKSSVAPLERVKILFQTGRMPGTGVWSTLSIIVRTEGILGLYRGNGVSVMRIIPYSALHFHAYEINRRLLLEHPWAKKIAGSTFESSKNLVDLIAGAGAGAAAVAVTYPLDLVRTRLACMSEVQGKQQGARVWTWKGRLTLQKVVGDVVRQEGVLGLYRGIGPTLMGILPYAGLKFYTYQSLKRHYHEFYHTHPAGSDVSTARLPIPIMLTFGGISGLVGQTVAYPLDVVRRRMQVAWVVNILWPSRHLQVPRHSSGFIQHAKSAASGSSDGFYTSTWDGLSKIVKSGGFRSLFAGLSINYMKVIPSTAIGFTAYDALKHFLYLKGHLV